MLVTARVVMRPRASAVPAKRGPGAIANARERELMCCRVWFRGVASARQGGGDSERDKQHPDHEAIVVRLPGFAMRLAQSGPERVLPRQRGSPCASRAVQ